MSYNECRAEEAENKESGRTGNGSDAEQEVVTSAPQGDSPESSAEAVGGQGQGYVYFIETEDHQFVKIGYSKRVYGRLSDLSTLRPGNFAIHLIGYFPGTIQTEGWLHAKFAADRDNGEWFRSTAVLREFIAMMGLMQPVIRTRAPGHRKRQCKIKPLVLLPEFSQEETADQIKSTPTPDLCEYLRRIGAKGGRAKVPKGLAMLSEQERKAVAAKGLAARWKNAEGKSAAAVELGRMGGKKKVPKGLAMMDPEKARRISALGLAARWARK